jgi:hypothetical protein
MQYLCLTPALPLVAELVNVRFRHSYKPSPVSNRFTPPCCRRRPIHCHS